MDIRQRIIRKLQCPELFTPGTAIERCLPWPTKAPPTRYILRRVRAYDGGCYMAPVTLKTRPRLMFEVIRQEVHRVIQELITDAPGGRGTQLCRTPFCVNPGHWHFSATTPADDLEEAPPEPADEAWAHPTSGSSSTCTSPGAPTPAEPRSRPHDRRPPRPAPRGARPHPQGRLPAMINVAALQLEVVLGRFHRVTHLTAGPRYLEIQNDHDLLYLIPVYPARSLEIIAPASPGSPSTPFGVGVFHVRDRRSSGEGRQLQFRPGPPRGRLDARG